MSDPEYRDVRSMHTMHTALQQPSARQRQRLGQGDSSPPSARRKLRVAYYGAGRWCVITAHQRIAFVLSIITSPRWPWRRCLGIPTYQMRKTRMQLLMGSFPEANLGPQEHESIRTTQPLQFGKALSVEAQLFHWNHSERDSERSHRSRLSEIMMARRLLSY